MPELTHPSLRIIESLRRVRALETQRDICGNLERNIEMDTGRALRASFAASVASGVIFFAVSSILCGTTMPYERTLTQSFLQLGVTLYTLGRLLKNETKENEKDEAEKPEDDRSKPSQCEMFCHIGVALILFLACVAVVDRGDSSKCMKRLSFRHDAGTVCFGLGAWVVYPILALTQGIMHAVVILILRCLCCRAK